MGTMESPGQATANPMNIKVRIREARSFLLLQKQRMTCSQQSFSSAYSRRVIKLSFEPSGRIPLGTSTYKLRFFRMVSQVTLCCPERWTVKLRLAVALVSTSTGRLLSSCAWRLFSLINKLLALTGGSVETPTPLPSVTNDTLAAWGASGARPRPCTKRYRVPLTGEKVCTM